MPPVEDAATWAIPAHPEDVEECVAFLVAMMEPTLLSNPKRIQTLTAGIAMQDYTRAELLLAMKRAFMANTYNGGFRSDIVDQIIQDSRRVRAIVGDDRDGRPRKLTERQMFDACQEHPDYFRTSDFGICGYDVNDRPFYLYGRKSGPHAHQPVPQIEEWTPAPRTDAGTGGPVSLTLLVKQQDAGRPSERPSEERAA